MENKKAKPTISDVARLCGVGTATVDRVLNERAGVSEKTRKKVLDTARKIGLNRVLPESHFRNIRIEILLSRPELPLIARMNNEFLRISRGLDRAVVVHRRILKEESPRLLAKAISETKCDAIVVYAADDPAIASAIEEATARGVKVITMISDLPHSHRLAYAGMDHYRAGRTAGLLMVNAARRDGPVAVLCNHLGISGHEERLAGFSDYLAERAPELDIVATIEGRDDRLRSEARLRNTFARQRDLVGVYNVGAANLGVEAAITADILENRPVFIGHELTIHTARLLRENVMSFTIDQSPEMQAQFAVDVVLNEFEFKTTRGLEPPYKSPVPIIIYSSENIPDGFDLD